MSANELGSTAAGGDDALIASASPSGAAHELADESLASPAPPLLHTLAQAGDMAKIVQLLDAGDAAANERDAEGISALHWAAMNSRIQLCKLLLDRGAEVDTVGGELHATPLHWAARNGMLPVVHLLIQHGADPAMTDGQGFNALHLAVHSHNPMLVAYLLSQQLPITIDCEDSAGQTGLQWACFQGDAISVALLLKAGADPNKSDAAGLTSVHWAVVKGSVGCIAKVVEAGGDCLKKNNADLNPVDLARQQHSMPAWSKAMESIGREIDGRPKRKPLNDRQTKWAIFALPLCTSFFMLKTLEILPWHTGCVLSTAEAYGMHHVITRVLLDGKASMGGTRGGDAIQKSPYLVALLSSSIFWVGYIWMSTLVSHTTNYAYTNLLFAAGCILCAYNLFRSVTLDPGYVSKPTSDVEVRETVEELTAQGRMNGQNFCLTCMCRQPLRSRHCRHCNRCVARFDHHCPWIYNCVGLNNHRQFICFVASLIVGILSFVFLTYQYLSVNAPTYDPKTMSASCLFPSPICASANYDVKAFAVALWSTLQLSWTFLVLGSHLYQICKGITTFEISNLGRYGHMGSRGISAASQEGFMAAHAASNPHTHGAAHAHQHTHNPLKLCARLCGRILPSTLLAIVGLDLYTKGRGAEGMVKAAEKGSGANPFNVGVMHNCTDFWTRGRTLGVDYEKLYDIPPQGYTYVIAQRNEAQKRAGAARQDGGPGYEMLRSTEEV